MDQLYTDPGFGGDGVGQLAAGVRHTTHCPGGHVGAIADGPTDPGSKGRPGTERQAGGEVHQEWLAGLALVAKLPEAKMLRSKKTGWEDRVQVGQVDQVVPQCGGNGCGDGDIVDSDGSDGSPCLKGRFWQALWWMTWLSLP